MYDENSLEGGGEFPPGKNRVKEHLKETKTVATGHCFKRSHKAILMEIMLNYVDDPLQE